MLHISNLSMSNSPFNPYAMSEDDVDEDGGEDIYEQEDDTTKDEEDDLNA